MACCTEWTKSRNFCCFLVSMDRSIISRIPGCDELRQFLNVLVSIFFHLAVQLIPRGPYCTFSNCSLSLTPCKLVFLQLCKVFQTLQQFVFPCRTKFSWGRFFFASLEKIRTVSLESFVFIPFASTVLSNTS